MEGCVLLVCGHCPSSSLLHLHLLILQETMWSHMKSDALLICFPQRTSVFGFIISWLGVCSSPLEAPVINPSSSSPLFPCKSYLKNRERKSRNEKRQKPNGSACKTCAIFTFLLLKSCIQSLSYWGWHFLGQGCHIQPCPYKHSSASMFNKCSKTAVFQSFCSTDLGGSVGAAFFIIWVNFWVCNLMFWVDT